jgi:uncharacterized membrane protein
MEALLHALSHQIALAIQGVAIAVVACGSALALLNIARVAIAHGGGHGERRTLWLGYARWLVAGLTFQLAADIIETSFSPTWDEVGRLAAVAVIRTFLSYFLDREMEHAELVMPRITNGAAHAAIAGEAHERSD